MKRRIWMLICAILALPTAALGEDQVVLLPTLAPQVTIAVDVNPYAMDWTGYYGDGITEVQSPALLDEEKARVPALMARYEGGERPMESVLNKEQDVVVGVYSLPPEDYQGEQVFVLLPVHEMSDEELLQLIDGYARLGMRFDAEGLSWRNCARGGGLDATRYYMGDERERVDTLSDLYKRQGLRPEQPLTALPGDDGVGIVQTDPNAYSYMREFDFKPYRRLTDEELLTLIQREIGENIPDAALYNQYEKMTRQQLGVLLGMPLSVELIHESLNTLDEPIGTSREVFTSAYRAAADDPAALVYWAELDTQTGLIYWADAQPADYEALPDSDLRWNPNDEQWFQIVREEVASLRRDGTEIVSVSSLGEFHLDYGGYCMHALVTMADGSGYTITIPCQTQRLHSANYYQSVDQYKD